MNTRQDSYFNTPEYLDYLKKNFDLIESSRERDATCKRPDLDLIMEYTDRLEIKAGQDMLEIGSGLGRLLDFFSQRYQVIPSGVDVSEEATLLARERLPALARNIKCGAAEKLPFIDCSFDHALCWAVFDLTQQGKVIAEMMRVLKPGGALLLTGKNNLFMADDEDALIAETKSREKGIPNHYTDYNLLQKAVRLNGGDMEMEHFFLRRGDFMLGRHTSERPERFIEYCITIRKRAHVPPVCIDIAEAYSRTWRLLNG